ncbi:hypothetical protein CGRA01v4_04802 [Colletotrichum graminicola]|uniref:Uncharacterized protein n=1 Tax=Colletotrichum graminicola (strain M1.001 / M2 / FGSC 10212) TaxID=645133 RepID=E3QLM9_COLGM|nr:uncharacterized protein GLRG_06742 [Colletotrichum graminicola M1.001]EFQ31767.1 hypothetical protein GLRG_06742 [Colletotrichum graminicola M1.001]WDK13521.1 hypothetical protein CGRA01v4_04802 [Colletotrichum graminicola]
MEAPTQPSSPPPPKPSEAPPAFGLGRRIREFQFDMTRILPGPRLVPNLLVSDIIGFLLYAMMAPGLSSFFEEKLYDAVPLAWTVCEGLRCFLDAFREERWHQVDHAQESADRWCSYSYRTPPPRLRSYREILNRQQALRNCCGAQLRGLGTRDVVGNMLLQATLAFCWAWALLRDHVTLVWLLAAIENGCAGYRGKIETSTPPAVRRGERTMPVARGGGSDDDGGPPYWCLGRVQWQISRGHDLISKFVELDMCHVGGGAGAGAVWDETEWLSEKDGEIPADAVVDEDRLLVNRVAFSACLSWLMVSISCDFATFYLLVLLRRLRGRLEGCIWGT